MSVIEACNDFFIKNSGTTSDVLDQLVEGTENAFASSFFKPFQNVSDVAYRGTSVVTAPVIYSVLTAQIVVGSVMYTLSSLINLVQGEIEMAKDSAKDTGLTAVAALFFLIVTVASPLINLIDFLGSMVSTFSTSNAAPIEENGKNLPYEETPGLSTPR